MLDNFVAESSPNDMWQPHKMLSVPIARLAQHCTESYGKKILLFVCVLNSQIIFGERSKRFMPDPQSPSCIFLLSLEQTLIGVHFNRLR